MRVRPVTRGRSEARQARALASRVRGDVMTDAAVWERCPRCADLDAASVLRWSVADARCDVCEHPWPPEPDTSRLERDPSCGDCCDSACGPCGDHVPMATVLGRDGQRPVGLRHVGYCARVPRDSVAARHDDRPPPRPSAMARRTDEQPERRPGPRRSDEVRCVLGHGWLAFLVRCALLTIGRVGAAASPGSASMTDGSAVNASATAAATQRRCRVAARSARSAACVRRYRFMRRSISSGGTPSSIIRRRARYRRRCCRRRSCSMDSGGAPG